MVTINQIIKKKILSEKISMVTAYDYSSAIIVDEAGVDIILVGDSLGMVVQGRANTLSVTMNEMIYHTGIVSRAVNNALVVGDMPFMSYQNSVEAAVDNAGRFIKEAGASAVKLEGGVDIAGRIRAIVGAEIPVMGHIGLTPQSINRLGRYSVQGKGDAEELKLMDDARAVEEAGAFAVVMECVPEMAAKKIAGQLSIPCIGCGAGQYSDGHVIVYHDLLGISRGQRPRFAKRYANLFSVSVDAVAMFKKEIENGTYPSEKETY